MKIKPVERVSEFNSSNPSTLSNQQTFLSNINIYIISNHTSNNQPNQKQKHSGQDNDTQGTRCRPKIAVGKVLSEAEGDEAGKCCM